MALGWTATTMTVRQALKQAKMKMLRTGDQ